MGADDGPHLAPMDAARDTFFDRVVQQHAPLLYRVAYSVLRNPADAEDAVSDALLKLLRSGAWQQITRERAFLTRTVWRCALDRLTARAPGLQSDPDATLVLEELWPSPEEGTIAAQERALLHRLIDRLPEELRAPLLLSAVEELNSREIGEVMHLPEGTVRTRLMRARRQLREWYEAVENRSGREVAARGMNR